MQIPGTHAKDIAPEYAEVLSDAYFTIEDWCYVWSATDPDTWPQLADVLNRSVDELGPIETANLLKHSAEESS